MTARVLAKMGETVRARGMIYKAVDQLVLLYGSESWVVTGGGAKGPGGVPQWLARRITGMTETFGVGG